MCPKTGRPKISNPKSVEVKVRFTAKTNKKLLCYAEKNSITRAETIRLAVDSIKNGKAVFQANDNYYFPYYTHNYQKIIGA